jgi:hypothetical protein
VAVELELRKVSLRPTNVQQMASAWLSASRVPAEIVGSRDDSAELFIAGTSIRGFSLNRRWVWFRNRIDLRLSVAASRGDWQAAFSFVRFAREHGFDVYSEDGVVLRADALGDDAALERGGEQFAQDVGFLLHLTGTSGEGVVELPNARFSVPVRSSDLPAGSPDADALESVHAQLLSRAAKYAAARSASLITLKTGETAVVWSGEALVAPSANYIVLGRGEFDSANCVYVSWDQVMSELEDIVEKTQRNPAQYYFAAVDPNDPRWRRLFGAGAPLDQLRQPAD